MLSLIRILLREIHAKISPLGYARRAGVRMGSNVRFYGLRPGRLGSEPFLIALGSNVYITAGVTFITHDGGTLILRGEVPDLELTAPITVGSNVYIGLNALILPGVSIGNRVIIGAGSVVTKDIPDNSVAAGDPARVLRTVDEYLDRAMARSLHLGHLPANEKEQELRKLFGRC